MSRRSDRAALRDLVDAAREAVEMFDAATPDELERDRRTLLALTHLVVIVGEAANRCSPAIRERHPRVPWEAIRGMRNRLVHGYDQVSREILHDTVAVDLPRLIDQVSDLLGSP